jgi:hypothetical protein
MEEEKHLATDETNENMEKDKMIDNGNIISWYKCNFNSLNLYTILGLLNSVYWIFLLAWVKVCIISKTESGGF